MKNPLYVLLNQNARKSEIYLNETPCKRELKSSKPFFFYEYNIHKKEIKNIQKNKLHTT